MPAVVVGRDAELAVLDDFVGAISDGCQALVLEGEAGMGKTTLWEASVADAAERGVLVLEARPAESETELSFSALGDLLDPVLSEVLESLPAVQRHALSRALVLEEVEGPPPNGHAVGVALLGALRRLAAERLIIVAVDDVQWLDAASAATLAYAGRRLRDEPVRILFARRTGLASSLVDELSRSLARRLTTLEVGPLDAAALHRVVQDRLGAILPRPLVAEVCQASGGNPFYAIEIVRTLQRRGSGVEAGQPLPVPRSLHDLVDERLLALPVESRDFLLAAAAHAHPTVSITEAASEIPANVGLAPALDAGIVELDGVRIRFTHPLLAACAFEAAAPLRRRTIHARLAGLLTDPEARAWQLAASVDEPDASVAGALEAASEHACARGAPRPAALLLDRASELTPASDSADSVRRAVDAAYLHFEAGDSPRAEAGLRDLLEQLPTGAQRARTLKALAKIRTYVAPREAASLFFEVLEQAEGDRELLAGGHEGVASCLLWLMERLDEVVGHSQTAIALARELGDDGLAADAVIVRLWAEGALGRESARATADEALSLEASVIARRLLDQPSIALAEYWIWIDLHERAHDAITSMMRRANELGDEASRPYLHFLLATVDTVMGRLDPALEGVRAGLDAAEQSGQPLLAGFNLALESLVLAQLGRGTEAELAVERARSLVPANAYAAFLETSALAHFELSKGDAEHAVARLGPLVETLRRESIAEPGLVRPVVDQVECLVELGRGEEASELLEWYESHARRLERASALANSARCRGLLAAQGGELDEALAAYGEALEWHSVVDLPLDRARTLLALGGAQRRTKRRREARATLEEALGIFERIGAALWAERARAELKRISGRAAAPGALTPAEERVAALVADGKANREVAAALFLSERTVEGHLARIYAKLGIRGRTEIASALASGQTQVVAAPNTRDSPVSAEPSAP